MTLFARGRDVVVAFPDAETVDGDGNRVRRPVVSGVEVRGRFEFTSGSEDSSDGDVTTTGARFFTAAWPTGFAGRVTFDGRDWDVEGDPQRHGGSRLVDHMVVRLRARAPRPVS